MATPLSQSTVPDRRARLRQQTLDEALEHALAVMAEHGVGALTVSEVARRLGMRAPSLYKHFPAGLHDLYDALFARGVQSADAASTRGAAHLPPGVERLRAGGRAYVRWAVENAALAQLLHWRVVPGFTPSPAAMALAERSMQRAVEEVRGAVQAGELLPAAQEQEALAAWTVLLSGLMTQQMANQPGARFGQGRFTRHTDSLLDLWFERYRP